MGNKQKLLTKLEELSLKKECTSKNLEPCISEIEKEFGTNYQELKKDFEDRAQKFHNLQLADKILMNALYGYFGTKTCRFYRVEIAESITLTGQEESKRVQKILEEAGYNILYGDTDSMFILVDSMPNEIKDDIEKAKQWIREQFVPRINELSQQELEKMAKEIGVKEPKLGETYHFTFKQEMIARSGIFLPGVSKGEAKKRYDLWVIDEEGVEVDKIASAGTPLKQSKLPKIVKEYFLKFINKLLKEMVTDEDELLKYPRELREKILEAGENWDLQYFGSSQQFNKPLHETDSKSAQFAIKWNELAEQLKLPIIQINIKYKFIEVVPKREFQPTEIVLTKYKDKLNLIRELHQFVLTNRIGNIPIIEDSKEMVEIVKSIFDVDIDRLVEKYVTSIFKPYFKVLNIPIEKIAFDYGDVDDLL